ncbi:DNA-binding response regulator, OmpR family, contains REC and winged-helix (wHTH) domain [Thiothrix eikelboomii]|uniref:DNA-binding response regulator, OmpR family, contains REC and winged-helix (WHTH) domain n=2 Tax=Thiothrix eikelboomii TaxID=92487 RepID=A0A1T4XLV1_9GAMM|nr:DNA-binding response regulator, OmpR family, contains REC and winged-helix (wHTH) domain [Thiothrix eikelboomii]
MTGSAFVMDNEWMPERLLLIDDDLRLSQMLVQYLGDAGYSLICASTGREGLKLAQQDEWSLIILDLMLPDADGLDLCRQLRVGSTATIPILMLTARGDATDRIIGLEMGADDYLPKPFEPRELRARIKAILRRGLRDTTQRQALRFGRLELDREARETRVDGQLRELTSYQFDLLVAMAERAGRVLSREQLMDMVKGETLEAFDRSIDVHISRIRAAIEDNPKQPKRIITLRGAGYIFARSQDGEDQ